MQFNLQQIKLTHFDTAYGGVAAPTTPLNPRLHENPTYLQKKGHGWISPPPCEYDHVGDNFTVTVNYDNSYVYLKTD